MNDLLMVCRVCCECCIDVELSDVDLFFLTSWENTKGVELEFFHPFKNQLIFASMS